jgi:hypothetical protein
LSIKSEILHLPIETKIIKEFPVSCYQEIKDKVKGLFDLYIVDGPFGSPNFSRYDICLLSESFNRNDEFIIIIDDAHRKGEKETVGELINNLNSNGIKTYSGTYHGAKDQVLIATEKYKLTTTL